MTLNGRRKWGVVAFKPKPFVRDALVRFMRWATDHQIDVLFHSEIPASRFFTGYRAKRASKADLRKTEFVLSFGGDGTLLSAARMLRPAKIPIAGISVGSMGFLTDIRLENLEDSLEKVLAGKARIVDRMMLDVEVWRKGKRVWHDTALNEAVVSKSGIVKLLNLSAWSDRRFISRFCADGLIVATPTGSTAYSLSAGGPLLYPSLEAIVLTPVSPHALTERPMILPATRKLRIVVEERRPPALVSVDGKEHCKLLLGDEVRISRSKQKTRLVKLGNANHFDTLREKLNWSRK